MLERARILVVGDNALVREGLRTLLKGRVTATVEDVVSMETVAQGVLKCDPTLVLLALTRDTQACALKSVLDCLRTFPFMVLAPAPSSTTQRYKQAFADTMTQVQYLPITLAPEEIVAAVQKRLGQTHGGAEGALRGCAVGVQFTPKEEEVLRSLVQGHNNKDIARELWVTVETVKAHLTSIYRKLGVTSRAEAIATYFYSADSSNGAPSMAATPARHVRVGM